MATHEDRGNMTFKIWKQSLLRAFEAWRKDEKSHQNPWVAPRASYLQIQNNQIVYKIFRDLDLTILAKVRFMVDISN